MTKANLALVLLTALLLSSCGPNEPLQEETYDNEAEVQAFYAAQPDRFVFASPGDLPPELDWQNGSELPTFGDPRAKRGGDLTLRINSMQETLRVVGPDSNSTLRGPLWNANMVQLIERHPWADGYIPGLAREWALDPEDSRTSYFRIDPDARWSDGRRFTADDVFFSLYFALSPHLQAPAINRVNDENITRVTRYDDLTVAITATKPTPEPLFSVSTWQLVQREFYREFGEDYVDRYHWRFSPVTGAYVLDEERVNRGRSISLKRLDNWWADDKPFYKHRFNVDRQTFVAIRDNTKAFESFLLGEQDWHHLNQTELWHERTDAEPIARGYIERAQYYHQIPSPRNGVYMNAMHHKLTDRNVRLGIQHALNYEKVNQGIYRGDKRRVRSFADGNGDYSHPTLRARPFDLEMAERYFAQSGFAQRGDDGIRINAAGERLSFVFTIANRDDDIPLATVVKEEALKAGLELTIETLDPTAFFTKIFEKNHQIALHSWNTGYSPLPAFEWELRGVDAGKPRNFNTTNIQDDELDALLARWDLLSDPTEAKQVSHQIQERIHEFAAWVPGITDDYDRQGYWRWVRWPDYFQIPRYFFFLSSGVFWIDEDIKRETLEARKTGRVYPPVTRVYEDWRKN